MLTDRTRKQWLQVMLSAALLFCSSLLRAADPVLLLPDVGLQPRQLAVVVNSRDPLSRQIGDYYVKQHGVPRENLLEVTFDPGQPVMHPGEFAVLRRTLEAKTPVDVQAYLLTWAQPYRVGCMSITSAFAFGYDRQYCAQGCKPTAESPYATSVSLQPYSDLGIRPSVMLAAESFDEARELIDRGVESIGWYFRHPPPEGQPPAAYLVETPDKNRSVRAVLFPWVETLFGTRLTVRIEQTETIEGADNILFYFTGAKFVAGIDTNRYLPGAIADHLTSTGGQLTDSFQMSALEWLRAGVTGSYGTVVEPCNLLEKFPNPIPLIQHYLGGRTLLEAYWKSVRMPGQGVFIGDPLAAPFRGYRLQRSGDSIEVLTAQLIPGFYKLLGADSEAGPFALLTSGIEIGEGAQHFRLSPPYQKVYRLERLHSPGDLTAPFALPPLSEDLLSSP